MKINSYGSYLNYRQDFDTSQTQAQQDAKEEEQTKGRKGAQKTPDELTAAEKQEVSKLQARDAEVRAHEAAHQAAAGGLAGGAGFEYQKGPDGKMYAIGGEVPITFREGSTPQETIANARQVKSAALAPANPSPQDYAVANSAAMMELKAQQELLKEKMQEMEGGKAYAKERIALRQA